MKTSRGSSPNTGYYFSSQFCTSVLQDFSLQNKYEQITKTSVLKSKAVLTFKHVYLQTYYSWLNHYALLSFSLVGFTGNGSWPGIFKVISGLLQHVHTKSVFVATLLALTSSDTTFLLRNSLIPFITSSPVNFSSLLAVKFKLSLLSCSVSIASNSSLHNSALNCAITGFGIFRKQEINSFSMPSDTLMDCCKILHFLMSQNVPLE